ncbi:MAG: YgjP-like metallopeptidase domain-containing protein [Candidatus Gracilibacteria bacterium]|jgi:hypothetical protein
MNKYTVEYVVAAGRTSSVRISGKKVVIRLSRFAHGRHKDEMIAKFLKWAEKRIKKAEINFFGAQYVDGGRVVTHNKVYEINVVYGGRKTSKIILEDGFLIKIYLKDGISLSKAKELIKFFSEKIIMEDQEEYLKQTVDGLNRLHFGKKYGLVRFKKVSSRFGSCSRQGNINIAFRLLFAPKDVFRYVCVHELAHLIEFNHSKRFWALVYEAIPDYKISEKWLKNSGFLLG